ncbi:tRNA lysidine(34) synthetase TilS [Ornithinibacillus sp. L9]|uniref:tRNA(Ile)-lysidine synthase n=1 Tax=Ornithinibacillus caprae TaxID=2678566 RepID=A0A6N8FH81_9BACI|nr:tRNA lysidine(34) synthetase TilS [Ornithinibacillus caprae]MUK88056.1 tRNA lysidine(34) synthetase TilS [Ornithinibacillus caprae]
MKDEVTAFIKKHQLLKENATVLVGVSGGPDSLALLHYLREIQADWKLTLIALSVDHQLRGEESKKDVQYVADLCSKWNIGFVSTSVDVYTYKNEHQVGTQVAARVLRYEFFKQQMESYQADYLALGHHGDDQIETILMRLVRTADSSSFSGIPYKRLFGTGEIIRPLLCTTKASIEDYCRAHDIVPRLDPSNEETVYTRNYFRKFVLPILKEKNNNIHTTIQLLSESLHEDEMYLSTEARSMFEQVVYLHDGDKIATFDIEKFKSYATALQRRTYHLILNYLYDELPDNLSYVHEEQFFALLQRDKGNVQIDFPQQLIVEKSYQTIRFSFQSTNPQDLSFHYLLDIPGEVVLPDGSKVSATYVEQDEMNDRYDKHTYVLSGDIALPLHIRTRKNGDRMRWKGLNGSKKIKDIFIDAKIPLHKRDIWPIITDNNGEIIWLAGIKKGNPKTCKDSNSLIKLYYQKGKL